MCRPQTPVERDRWNDVPFAQSILTERPIIAADVGTTSSAD
jgi:hypothetical protein